MFVNDGSIVVGYRMRSRLGADLLVALLTRVTESRWQDAAARMLNERFRCTGYRGGDVGVGGDGIWRASIDVAGWVEEGWHALLERRRFMVMMVD